MYVTREQILQITQQDLPCSMLTHCYFPGYFGWRIRTRSKSMYQHEQILYRPGVVASQGLTYRKHNIEKWLNGQYRVKLWFNPLWTEEEKHIIIADVELDLCGSLWSRSYDFIGIIGQRIGIRKFQSPWQYYCSERTMKHWYAGWEFSDHAPLISIPICSTPGDNDRWYKAQGWLCVIYDPIAQDELRGSKLRQAYNTLRTSLPIENIIQHC